MSQPQSRSEVYYIALTGIFIGLTLLVKVVFDYFPGINVLANGYPIDFYLVFYVYGMILINRRK
jgi:hypothetical protein